MNEELPSQVTPLYYNHGYALFIGIQYLHHVKPLHCTLTDINALSEHFKDLQKAAYNPNNVICLAEKEATKDGIITALDDLVQKANGDSEATVIVYYSGHGANHENNYFLVPYDFDWKDWQNTSLLSTELAEKIAAIKAKKCMIILDCCYAEGMPLEKGASNVPDFLDGFVNEINDSLEKGTTEKALSNTIQQGSGRVILTSCESKETSLALQNMSLFTQVLLESLNGAQNIEEDGWVRLIDLMRYVPKVVADKAKSSYNHEQHPMFKRIENLKHEDFIICAYDFNKAKGLVAANPLPINNASNLLKQEIINLLDGGDFVGAFVKLDTINITDKFQYKRLKTEYTAGGLKGIELLELAERLKVFVGLIKF